MKYATLAIILALSACARESTPADPADAVMTALRVHCGKAYEGRIASDDPRDERFASSQLVMHVRNCAESEIRIPFHVGDDRSRTWVITRTDAGLRLKHDHRHEDGSEDSVTQYGGDSAAINESRAEFPVDDYSIAIFEREGLTESVTNVWAIEITDAQFAYELFREGRFFRVEFDLSAPVAAPPAPWGA